MPDIKFSKDKDGYSYEYMIIGSDNKKRYVSKSGFKTLKEAQEASKISYSRRIKEFQSIKAVPPVKRSIPKINKFDYTDKLIDILTYVTIGGVGIGIILLSISKLSKEIKDRTNIRTLYGYSDEIDKIPCVINKEDCDFSNLHVILRAAKKETSSTAMVVSNQLTRLGLSNEVINKDTNYIDTINNNLDNRVILINIETGVESNSHITILNDSLNKNKYPADVLSSCINTSSMEYGLDPVILSGASTGNGWRLETSIERNLLNNNLNNSITELTIDLPTNIDSDTIRNNCASSIVEGLMRYTYLPVEERYSDIYYCAKYGDTVADISDKYNVTPNYIYENSSYNRNRPLTVGDTLMISEAPVSARSNYVVNNPLVTSDINQIELIYVPYVVKENDTLTKIANLYSVRIEDIRITSSNPNNIRIGETIFIPQFNYYLTSPKQDILNNIEKKK